MPRTRNVSFYGPGQGPLGGGALRRDYQSDPRRRMEQQLMAQGSSTAPVQSPLEGITRALSGVAGGFFASRDRRALEAKEAAEAKEVNAILAGWFGKPYSPPAIDDPSGGDYEGANYPGFASFGGFNPPTRTGSGYPGALAAVPDAQTRGGRAMLQALRFRGADQQLERERAELLRERTLTDARTRRQHEIKLKETVPGAAPGEGGSEKWGKTPVWGVGPDGKQALGVVSDAGNFKVLEMGEFEAKRGQISMRDLGDRWGIYNADGDLIGSAPKGLAPSRSITDGRVVTLPPVPAQQFFAGGALTGGEETLTAPPPPLPNVPDSAATVVTPSGVRVEDLPLPPEVVQKKTLGTEQKAVGAGVMLTAIRGAKEQLQLAQKDWLSFGGSGTASRLAGWNSSSYAGKVNSYIGTLKSGVVEQGIKLLRESSAAGATGFGAMNKEELLILVNRLGALDPPTTDPEILLKTLSSIEKQTMRVMADIQKNVSPERLKELGLSDWVSGGDGASPARVRRPSSIPQEVWDNMPEVDKDLFK